MNNGDAEGICHEALPERIGGNSRDKAGAMKASLRLKTVLLAAGLGLLPAPSLAQNVPDASTNTPASDAIGPKELQNFSLPGTATRPAEQPSSPPTSTAPANDTKSASSERPAPTPAPRSAEVRRTAPPAPAPSQAQIASVPGTAPQPLPTAPSPATQPSSTAAASPVPLPPGDTAAPAPEQKLTFLPWLIAALVLAGGTLYLLWRRRLREAPEGPLFDLFTAPEPKPAPAPPLPQRAPTPRPVASPPPRPAPPAANGIVASRLRPSIEIGMQPLRCLIDDSQVTIEFEVELFNAGTAPARAVFAEARLLNASATQDQELAAFFARPDPAGERMESIGPMKRVTLTNRVVAPRSAVQEYELAGRKAFVPVIAFNALYEWSGGKGQSSLAYLVGRETRTEKLGPLQLDGGSRDVRGLGARPLPIGVRT